MKNFITPTSYFGKVKLFLCLLQALNILRYRGNFDWRGVVARREGRGVRVEREGGWRVVGGREEELE